MAGAVRIPVDERKAEKPIGPTQRQSHPVLHHTKQTQCAEAKRSRYTQSCQTNRAPR